MSSEASSDWATGEGMPTYVAVFPGKQPPPKEHEFYAIADDHAKELMMKEYPSSQWMLYRVDKNQRHPVCSYTGRPHQQAPPSLG